MDTDFQDIYLNRAENYHQLVMREDYPGNLMPSLLDIADFRGKIVVELGAGTGRLTKLIAAHARSVRAFDRSRHMLDQAVRYLQDLPFPNVSFMQAENRSIPLPEESCDILVEGWSFGHTVVEEKQRWREVIEELLSEAFRVVKKGGTVIVIETLGSGKKVPSAPGETLAQLYAYLESERGFRHGWIRTDYKFPSMNEATTLIGMFFGEMLDHEVNTGGEVIVPECTGIWWMEKAGAPDRSGLNPTG
jgi:ubiquinone/menaquinone biosynthesis C-methylase UbiE